jgi:hypothetical protein
MPRGKDRFAVGESVCSTLFPEGSGHLLGTRLGDELTELATRAEQAAGPGSPATFTFTVDDPEGKGRVLELRAFHQKGRVNILDGRFYSTDRMDVDSAYRYIRKHLERAHGKPDKELTGVLKFLYDVEAAAPARTSICRYRDDEGRNVLEVATRLKDGVSLPGIHQRLSGAKRGA